MKRLKKQAKILLFVLGTVEGLKALGFAEGGFFELTDSGRDHYRTLVANGYEPTERQLRRTMLGLLDYEESLKLRRLLDEPDTQLIAQDTAPTTPAPPEEQGGPPP